jgi:5-methylcytosine-specific restriction endonuclease McrA
MRQSRQSREANNACKRASKTHPQTVLPKAQRGSAACQKDLSVRKQRENKRPLRGPKKVVKQRTPQWLTNLDRLKIRCMYQLASMYTRENNEPWHVDHVIPLQGNIVSGLHVPSNLRVLRGLDNIKKKNKYEVLHG